MNEIKDIPLNLIDPSPYQHRRYFAKNKLIELANSIKRDGLIEPIVVRPKNGRYELIAGERRWRASQLAEIDSLLARVIDVPDLQARRMCAAENLQREDLSQGEEIRAIVEIIDAELYDDDYYQFYLNFHDPVIRVTKLLQKMQTATKHGYVNSVGHVSDRIDIIMESLPNPKEWDSFLRRDLPILINTDDDVKDLAARVKASKAKTLALQKMKKETPQQFDELQQKVKQAEDEGGDPEDAAIQTSFYGDDPISITEASARDIERAIAIAKSQETRDHYYERGIIPDFPIGNSYRVFYIDPPWKYNDKGLDDYGHAERHYNTMSIDELCEMGEKIKEISHYDAVLFLWVTSPLLEESFKIINAWGFRYKTSFVWDKVKHNFGHYNSVRHEFLLVCTKGSCTPDVAKLFDSVQEIERSSKHSEKPKEFRSIIEVLYTQGQKIELFARTKGEGWDTWGDEVAP